MFCPNCKAEYQEGYLECGDCKVELVDELPAEPSFEPVFVEYEPVATITDIGMAAIIKSLLEEEHIVYFIKGEESIHLYPSVPTQVMVRRDQADQAKELLKDLVSDSPEEDI